MSVAEFEHRRDRREKFEPDAWYHYETTSDAAGKFVVAKLPPGIISVARAIKYNDTGRGHNESGSHREKITVGPGETGTVVLGGVGRPVTGKLVVSEEFTEPVDWNYSHINCRPVPNVPQPDFSELRDIGMKIRMLIPESVQESLRNAPDPETQKELLEDWKRSDDGKKVAAEMEPLEKQQKELVDKYNGWAKLDRESRQKTRVCAVARDGSFRLDDIFEGDWQLEIELDSPPADTDSCGPGSRLGKGEFQFTVAPMPGGVTDEPQDIGTVTVEMVVEQKPMIQAGQTAPDFELARIVPIAADAEDEPEKKEAEKIRLSDYKDKYVILDFWATWCGPCLEKLPELKKFYGTIQDDSRFVLIGISLDETNVGAMLGKFVAKKEMNWPHGLAGGWETDVVRSYGISGIPALVLIGPDGKVLLSNPSIPELTKKVEALRKPLTSDE